MSIYGDNTPFSSYLSACAKDLFDRKGLILNHAFDVNTDTLILEIFSIRNSVVRCGISRQTLEQSRHTFDIIHTMIDDMVVEVQKALKNDTQSKESDMTDTFTKEDTDKILQIKEKYKNVFQNHVPPTLEGNSVFAGGSFSSLWYSEVVKDYDLFILDEGTKKFENIFDIQFTGDKFVHSNVEYLKNPHIKKVVLDVGTKVQYIFTDYKTRKEVIDHFDMLHCCVSYDRKEDKLYISSATLDAVKKKIIAPNGDKKIQNWRKDKMIKRGWKEL